MTQEIKEIPKEFFVCPHCGEELAVGAIRDRGVFCYRVALVGLAPYPVRRNIFLKLLQKLWARTVGNPFSGLKKEAQLVYYEMLALYCPNDKCRQVTLRYVTQKEWKAWVLRRRKE